MTATAPSLASQIQQRVDRLESTPCIPTILLPLLELMKAPPEKVSIDEVVELVSCDNVIAAQCLRVASSPLFGLARAPESVKAAVISLGLRRVETILLTCCMPEAFPANNWALDPAIFWKHSLGCAMVCRMFCEKVGSRDGEQAYTAGLLHDIGIIVNSVAFGKDFEVAVERATRQQIPLDEAELAVMGFTHEQTGSALAKKWHLTDDLVEVIAHHHSGESNGTARAMVALVHLSDLLCRMRGLGYGYYERQKVDFVSNRAWAVLAEQHRSLEGVDLVRFTYELDEATAEICELVAMKFGGATRGKEM